VPGAKHSSSLQREAQIVSIQRSRSRGPCAGAVTFSRGITKLTARRQRWDRVEGAAFQGPTARASVPAGRRSWQRLGLTSGWESRAMLSRAQ